MARVRSRHVLPLWIALLLGAQLFVVFAARASNPPMQQVSVPSQAGKTVKITWTGTILPGANATSSCSLGLPNEDHHQVQIKVPSGIYSELDALATFGITWAEGANALAADEILTVFGPDGEEISSSDGGDPSESVPVKNPVPGTYDAVACGFTNTAPTEYTGTLVIKTSGLPVPSNCRVAPPSKVKFAPPIYIDQNRAGGEPVSVVAQDGSIIVSSHAGTTHLYKNPAALAGVGDFAVGYFNQTLNWRSADDGRTWNYVGTFGNQVGGPHTLASTGFSDPDLTIDAGGRIYNAEIPFVAGLNVSVYSSNDDGQSFGRGNPVTTVDGDRPWVLGKDPDEVFLTVSGGELARSTNGGLTFENVTNESLGQGKLLNDPINPAGIIAPYSDESHNSGIAISPDRGKTWKGYPVQLGKSTQFFSTVGVDRAGWVYVAAAGGYEGAGDSTPDGQVTFSYFNRKTKRWAPPVEIPAPKGDALWPWIIAGDDGRVSVVWYQSLARAPERWYIYQAYTLNAHGTRVRCNGRLATAPPSFRVSNASGRVIHANPICLLGTLCVAAPNPRDSDRRLGDFFTVNFDRFGNVFIASGDTMLANPLGGPKVVSNPIFIRQIAGPRLLLRPMKTRATRPLCEPPCLP